MIIGITDFLNNIGEGFTSRCTHVYMATSATLKSITVSKSQLSEIQVDSISSTGLFSKQSIEFVLNSPILMVVQIWTACFGVSKAKLNETTEEIKPAILPVSLEAIQEPSALESSYTQIAIDATSYCVVKTTRMSVYFASILTANTTALYTISGAVELTAVATTCGAGVAISVCAIGAAGTVGSVTVVKNLWNGSDVSTSLRAGLYAPKELAVYLWATCSYF